MLSLNCAWMFAGQISTLISGYFHTTQNNVHQDLEAPEYLQLIKEKQWSKHPHCLANWFVISPSGFNYIVGHVTAKQREEN